MLADKEYVEKLDDEQFELLRQYVKEDRKARHKRKHETLSEEAWKETEEKRNEMLTDMKDCGVELTDGKLQYRNANGKLVQYETTFKDGEDFYVALGDYTNHLQCRYEREGDCYYVENRARLPCKHYRLILNDDIICDSCIDPHVYDVFPLALFESRNKKL